MSAVNVNRINLDNESNQDIVIGDVSTSSVGGEVSAASIEGQISAAGVQGQIYGSAVLANIDTASVEGTVTNNTVLGDATIAGAIIKRYEEVQPATQSRLGSIIVGEHLLITNEGVLSVEVVQNYDEDNTHPISASAVYTEIGNISALINTI